VVPTRGAFLAGQLIRPRLTHPQLWQLRNVRSDAPCLIRGQHLRDVSRCAVLPRVDVGDRLPVGVPASAVHGGGKRPPDKTFDGIATALSVPS
jgi:hypothetical protein